MRIVLCLLICCFASAAVQVPTAKTITLTIKALYPKSSKLLNVTVFNKAATYQSKALASATRVLVKTGANAMRIKEYYVLACLQHATNAVPNPRTKSMIPGQKLVRWTKTTSWIQTSNYCKWYGIKCGKATSDVTEIRLSKNGLTGEFPNEILLLGKTLKILDLSSNIYHWKGSFDWMKSMSAMQKLYFGTTAWDSNGIPYQISFMKRLTTIDMSKTFFRGNITEAAFTDMPKLEYIDMGDNSYVTGGKKDFPSSIVRLPSLTRLYMDNVKFTDGGKFNLNFLSSLFKAQEVWMDFTKFSGGIPSDIGKARNLQSLSLTYCGITGTIPASLSYTLLNRMWLYGNKLNGTIPSSLASRKWSYLYLEGNSLGGTIPSGICKQTAATNSVFELGADCTICQNTQNCCSCCGFACNNLYAPTRAPTRPPTRKPTRVPTSPRKPTRRPIRKPTRKPTRRPIRKPTRKPTRVPTVKKN